MPNNENKCEEIFKTIDEYYTEKPEYPCWSLFDGDSYETFPIGDEESLKNRIKEYLDMPIEDFYDECEELTLYYEETKHQINSVEDIIERKEEAD
jgi:hypothetical protein